MTGLRPNSTRFWSSYLRYGTYSQERVWRIIGGGIGLLYGPNENTCAARVSYGLNYGGAPIRAFAEASRNYPAHVYEGTRGDDLRYIVSAEQMERYLRQEWGAPDHSPGDLEVVDEIVRGMVDDQCAIFATRGHTGVLRRGYQDPYISQFLPVSVWILP